MAAICARAAREHARTTNIHMRRNLLVDVVIHVCIIKGLV